MSEVTRNGRGECKSRHSVHAGWQLTGNEQSYSTRIAEVENAGKSNERELPVGNDHGYIWRLYSYWRIEEKDSGVYVQGESIGLSRTIPWTI